MRFYRCFAVCLLLVLFSASAALASSMCDQTFTIHGKTKGETSLLFWDEYRGGQCGEWYGCALVLGIPGTPLMTLTADRQTWVASLLDDLPTEEMERVEASDGVYRINDSVWVEPPPEDTIFVRKFSGLVSGGSYGDARAWHRMCSSNCEDYPIVHGCVSDVVYAYEGGVYKNYTFKEVLYYPESGYLVVTTDQPLTAVGLDTMHGLLVLKLEQSSE